MRKPVAILLAVITAAVTWIFFKNFQIAGLTSLRVEPRSAGAERFTNEDPWGGGLPQASSPQASSTAATPASMPAAPDQDPTDVWSRTVRVGSFQMHAFNTTKASKPHVMDLFARIGRQFDVLALQGIESAANDLIPRLVDLMNQSGRQYDFLIGPRIGPAGALQQYAFVYDRATIQADRSELYTVDDPDDLLSWEPLVGWFRTTGTADRPAFTFSLINIRVDPENVRQELDVVDDVLFAVRDDGRQEDDVILLGDLRSGYRHWGELQRIQDLGWVLADVPTNTEGTHPWDNLLFLKSSTREFTGRGGTLDFLRKYNLGLNEALEISDHLPVWGEFTVYEGGDAARFAAKK